FTSTMWVLGSNTLARGITDTGIAIGAAAALTLGAWRVSTGAMSLPALLVILMLGIEVFRPLRELRTLLHQGMLGTSAARGIFAILDATAIVRDHAAGPAPRHRRGQHPHGQARCESRRAAGRRAGGERRGVHRPAPAGLRDGRRRAGRAPLRRPAAAHRDRAGAPARRARAGARRGALVRRR